MSNASDGGPLRRSGGSPRGCLLLIEDDLRLTRALARVLEFDGFEVLTAGGGDDALAHARSRGSGIAVVVTDVLLPDAPVGELVSALAALCPGTPILFMSGSPTEQGVLPELGVRTQFLPKPFSPQELKVALRALIG